MSELKPCPCGKNIKELILADNGQGSKWALAYGNCCAEWMVEFRTMYYELNSEKCMKLAIEAWNGAPRANEQPTED